MQQEMDRKSTKKHPDRLVRSKKRKFCSNQHTLETEFASTSAAKLATSRNKELIIDALHGYRIIIEFLSVFTTISQFVKSVMKLSSSVRVVRKAGI